MHSWRLPGAGSAVQGGGMGLSGMELDGKLAELAAENDGLITVDAINRAKINRELITERVRSGLLQSVQPNVWLFGQGELTFDQQCRAAVASSGGFLSGVAALVWCRIIREPEEGLKPTVVVAGGKRPRLKDVVVIRTTRLEPQDRTRTRGLATATIQRAMLDASQSAQPKELERWLDDGLVSQKLTLASVRKQLNRTPGVRGIEQLRALVEERTEGKALTRSQAEQRIKALLGSFDGPQPKFLFVVRTVNGNRFEVDLAWPEHRIIIEIDGYQWHGGRSSWKKDLNRDAELVLSGWNVRRVLPEIDRQTLHLLIHSMLASASR
jgi:hypothetical protein